MVLILVIFALPGNVSAKGSTALISSFSELKQAIHAANDGDILYVDDIDFTPTGGINNSWMRIEINKSLTIRSGKDSAKDGSMGGAKAVFTNGSFILSGSKVAGESISLRFENIVFDGGINTANLKTTDFDYPWSEEEQRYLLNEPELAQYALAFKGNVDAVFTDCDFKNYMHEYGPVAQIRYDDYTGIPSLLEMFGDYSGCSINISLERCNITGNAAFYDGGAIFIEGNNNVTLTATDCVFADNYSGEGDFRIGGGAIYASGAKLTLERCRIENNSANHLFPDMELPDEDKNAGGGIYANNTKLSITDSYIAGNSASMGGGIACINTDAVVDGCIFTGNRAQAHARNWTGDVGPWNNMAQGGAVYHTGSTGTKVTIINSSIYGNSAQNAYGGIYSGYSGVTVDVNAGQLELQLCTYAGNTCDSAYDYSAEDMFPWCSHPGDFLESPYITTKGCVIIDESFERDFPRYEQPSESNAYNYIASSDRAEADGLSIVYHEEAPGSVINAPANIDFEIPAEYAEALLNGRYEGKLTAVSVGNNYRSALYGSAELMADGVGRGRTIIWIAFGVILIALALITALYLRRRKLPGEDAAWPGISEAEPSEISVSQTAVSEPFTSHSAELEQPVPETAASKLITSQPEISEHAVLQPATIIVKAWFTSEEIDKIIQVLPKARNLTGRESEVFVEILEGKKQKEIAYDLGIEITTVKDFCRKIYDKLDFVNKEDLLKKCSELIDPKV